MLGDHFKNGIIEEGLNCWKTGEAKRVAFLIDAEAYFTALVSAMEQATESDSASTNHRLFPQKKRKSFSRAW